MDKTKLLDQTPAGAEDRLMLAKVLDRLEQSSQRNIPTATDFLSPQQLSLVKDMLHRAGMGETDFVVRGGYVGAERNLVLFLPDWMEAEDAEEQCPLRHLRAQYRPNDRLTHRDILGSLMGLGIVREKIGDLLVGEASCDLVVAQSVAEFLLQSWPSAGRAKLQVTAIEPWELEIPAANYEQVRDTVMSLRLDAVAATGFKLARSKASALIISGRVEVNWKLCTKPDRLLEAGDIVSARGFGKFELCAVGGVSRKGRTGITVKRYG